MFDQILDNFRKAAESTIQFQQEMLRNWIQQWPQVSGVPIPGVAWTEQARAAQKKWSETITDMLNKHRETLDSQSRAGIRTIEDAFRVGEAKDPEQFRKLTEELWRQSFDRLKTAVESQLREFQAAMEKWEKWSETITDMLHKHREMLDSRYQAGIQTIEDAFRVAEIAAIDPEQFCKLTEQLWRENIDSLMTAVESQLREFQAAMEKWVEVASGV